LSGKEKEWEEFQERVKELNQQRDKTGFIGLATTWIKVIIKKEEFSH
jgi:hypothetical protein